MENTVVTKSKKLEEIRLQLKEEFIGLDDIIDKIMVSVREWHLFPELKHKPTIINLWGMTGVGKTSVVTRLVELLDYNKFFYHFDLGELSGNRFTIYDQLIEQGRSQLKNPLIICLDEFQRAKSKNEDGTEIRDPNQQILWQLLDTGKLTMDQKMYSQYSQRNLTEDIECYKYLIKNGVKAKKGIVTSNQAFYKEVMDSDQEGEKDQPLYFIHPANYSSIMNLSKGKFGSRYNVKQNLLKMDEQQSVDLLEEILQQYINPNPVDCSNALVFNLGNIDDLYPFSDNYTNAITPDIFHSESKKVNKLQLRECLKSLFRHEQLARLGNNHIIYPALNNKAFELKIDQHIQQLSLRLETDYQLCLYVSESVKKLIFKEGVIPTLGFRPLESVVEERVSQNVLLMVEMKHSLNIDCDALHLVVNSDLLSGQFLKREKVVTSTLLSRLPKEDMHYPEKLMPVAVHEAGHILCSVLLNGDVPIYVNVECKDGHSAGLVHYDRKMNEVTSQQDALHLMARSLAGKAAEEIVFGAENVTLGSESDIDNATRLASRLYKKQGLYGSNALYESIGRTEYAIQNPSIEIKVEALLNQANDLAQKTLFENKSSLVDLAWELIHAKTMNQLELIQAFNKNEIDYKGHIKKFSYHEAFSKARNENR